MDFFDVKEKSELMETLEAMWVAAEKIPEGTECIMGYSGICLFFPDECEISTIYGQEITQVPRDGKFDEHFVCVDGVKVYWLVPKEAGNDPEV